MTTRLPGIDADAVTGWLVDHVAGLRAPFTFTLIAAGASNLTYRVTDAGASIWSGLRAYTGFPSASATRMPQLACV